MVLAFDSKTKLPICNESYIAVLFCGAACFAIESGSNFKCQNMKAMDICQDKIYRFNC